ncbi:glycoside hydrolase family 3 N-terminal domain-containing protein [Legionella jamestowniensis]|uniref:beta-N-acetylhexosaminidase n=1 Tax=Legionella jamestowniensis TaxID=455 RepID=A0A0W0UTN1_9GAMM|nr:glycoside hydrolase family 3 N-terminal domain-containing protein [Legionella jamestowniensis]KTD11242.1 glycosyl hydrolase [Legionella jamestowniensis]SFL70100.1 beta-N-acetylhexosaminidase [Legionella jamestowniensis DSM 19215]
MTILRQQIAQMLIMGFSDTVISEKSPIKEWLKDNSLGGVLLFDYDLIHQRQGKNLVNRAQIKHLIDQLHQANNALGKGTPPLFIAVDYEGGAVDRLKYIENCTKTVTPAELAKFSSINFQAEVHQMANTLHELGFNLNFAPVIDLDLNQEEGIIGKLKRSFSAYPEQVVNLATQFVEMFSNYQITCCYKHFPGHGSAVGDTHEGFVDVTETFQLSELEPYRIIFSKENIPTMVMTAHVINRQLDSSGLPATLSKTILTDLLRQELGFSGVIISDDLQMHAIAKHYAMDDALCLTINAGADMIIFGNQLDDVTPYEVIDKIEKLVHENKISKDRIEEAYDRIIGLKKARLNFHTERS